MNRRQLLAVGAAGLGILAGCSSRGGPPADAGSPTATPAGTTPTATPATGPPLTLLSAEQVVEGGLPLNRTRLAFAVPDGVTVDAERFAAGLDVRVNVRDPVDDRVKPRQIPVSDVAVDEDEIEVIVAGPVSDGSEVTVLGGLSPIPGKTTLQTGTTPTEAALWFKAYRPFGDARENFARNLWTDTLNVVERTSEDPDVVLADLRRLLDLKVDKGMLSRERADEVLALWDDPTAREVFTSVGTFEPQLLAALLALAGTIGEPAIDAVLDGERSTGYPVKVRYAEQPVDLTAQVKNPLKPTRYSSALVPPRGTNSSRYCRRSWPTKSSTSAS
jgi:hypothetical protein